MYFNLGQPITCCDCHYVLGFTQINNMLEKKSRSLVSIVLIPLFFILLMFIFSTAGYGQRLDSTEVNEWVDIPVLEWEEFNSYDGGFRVRTPGPFAERIDTVKTAIGPIAYHSFMFVMNKEAYAENVFYMVSYCDYPKGALHNDSLELTTAFLDATIDEAVKAVRGELVYQQPIEINGFPGRFWRIHYRSGDAVIKTKAYVINNRYYQIQTAMTQEMGLNKASDEFLDSFRIISSAGSSR